MPSGALETLLDVRLAEVRCLEAVRPDGRGSPGFDQAQAVNRAAVVLVCAHLEGFLEDLIGDCVDAMNEATPDLSKIPRNLRAAHVETEIRTIGEVTDPEKFVSRVEAMFADYGDLWTEGPLSRRLEPRAVSAHLDNPGSKDIERVFTRLGLPDVLDQVVLSDEADVTDRVNELVGVRNAIAHGENVRVTDDQVARYIETLESLGRALDATTAVFVQKVLDADELPWT